MLILTSVNPDADTIKAVIRDIRNSKDNSVRQTKPNKKGCKK